MHKDIIIKRGLYYSIIIIGCLLQNIKSQTVDISQSIKTESKEDVKNPAQDLEAALKIEERDFQTLQKELQSWSGGRVDSMQQSWKRWIIAKENQIKENKKSEKDRRYQELIRFVHNRSNYLKDVIDNKISRRIFDIQCRSGLSQVQNELDHVEELGDILDIVNVAQFPIDSNPEEATKLGQRNNIINQYVKMPERSNYGRDIITSLRNGDYSKTLSIGGNALESINGDTNRDVDLKLKAIIFLERINLKIGNSKEANKYNKEAQKIIAANENISERIKCLAYAYGARTEFNNNQPEEGVKLLKNAITLFNQYIDTGFPFTDTESPYLCNIFKSCIVGLGDKKSFSDCQKEITELSDALNRLVESPKDNLVVPSEQCDIDSINVKLILARIAYLGLKYDAVIELCNSIHGGDGYTTGQRSGAEFSRENDLYLESLSLRALALKKLNKNETMGKSAARWTREWIDNYKKRINDIMQGASESQKMSLLDSEDPYSFLVNMEDPAGVAELTFFNKGVVLESMFNAKSIISNIGDSDLKNKMNEIDTVKALNQSTSIENINTQDEKLVSLERDLAEQIRKSYKETDILEFIKNIDFKAIPGSLKNASAFVDYIQYSDDANSERSYAALVITSQGKVTLKKLASVKVINGLVDAFRDFVKQPPSADVDKKMQSVCQELYKKLISPLNEQLISCKELIISPDGKLNFVPFAVFMNDKNQFILEKLQIRYVSSGRDLLRKTKNNQIKDIVIIDDPIFTKGIVSNNATTDFFVPLPGTHKESQNLQSIMSSASYNVKVLEGTNASEENICQIKSPRILHIATHGFNLAENESNNDSTTTRGMKVNGTGLTNSIIKQSKSTSSPMFKTGLALCGANDTFQAWSNSKIPDPQTDGILMAGEVPLIDLSNTALVTLSACQTAEGEAVGGEGVFGLRRGFLQAGTRNILMTLWPIADQETIDIMSEFYRRIVASDADPGGDLCNVQREFLTRLRSEKGITFAINRAAPFILFSQGKLIINENSSNTNNANKDSATDLKSDINPDNQTGITSNGTIMDFPDALAKADAGDAYAQGVVSIYYTIGYKVPKDTAKGLTYALKSAAQKNPLGIYQVGALRELGVGMKKDKAQGRKLMSEAFDGLNTLSGDPYALYDLACMAIEGVGVNQNPKEAARLFKASADMGYAPAQRMFAKFLEAGVGVPKNLEEARQYQSQSSAQWSQQ